MKTMMKRISALFVLVIMLFAYLFLPLPPIMKRLRQLN